MNCFLLVSGVIESGPCFGVYFLISYLKVSEYDQEIPQSHTADHFDPFPGYTQLLILYKTLLLFDILNM